MSGEKARDVKTAPLPLWQCDFGPGAGPGAPALDSLTVGSLFELHCRGDIEVSWGEGPLAAAFPAQDQAYSLYILKNLKLESRAVDLLVTAYKAGEHKPEYVRVVQGERGFEIIKPTWNVKSTLKPNEAAKPYPPFGPWGLSLPLWFYLILAGAAAAIIYFVARSVRRYSQRAKMLAELQRHKTALSPLHQFYRDSRNIRRKLHAVKQADELNAISQELNREFRLYVLRQFQIPALDWTDREIVRDLKKRHRRVYNKTREPLRKTLRELGHLASKQQILFKDIEQMQRMTLDAVEKIDEARSRSAR